MLLHQGLRFPSIFQNSGVCLLLPICAITWGTNLEVLEHDLNPVSHDEGTEPELSPATDSLGVWDPILVPHASDPGALYRAFRVLYGRTEVDPDSGC